MAASVNGVFRKDLQNAILKSKILVVGAGGIGCEILKNLVMTGFTDIEVVSFIFINKLNLSRVLPASLCLLVYSAVFIIINYYCTSLILIILPAFSD